MNNVKAYFANNPLMLTGVSALISAFVYSFIFGPLVSIGFTLSLFIHEMGHYVAARRQNISVTVPVFIPFVGALINFKENPYNAEQEAYIGIAGPIAGTIAAMISFALFQYTGNSVFLTVAMLGFFLNLFNLLPLSPLDGGRTVTVISPYIWLLGAAMLVGAFVYFKSFIILLVGLVGFLQIKQVLFSGKELSLYYKSKWTTKLLYASIYIGLSLFLTFMMLVSARYLHYLNG
jgi:Zn-dependent protease